MNSNTLYIIYEKDGVFGKPQKGLKLPILNPDMIEYVREQDMYFIPDKRIIGMLYLYPGEYEIKMSCGWQPSYNDPDNKGGFPPAEPEGIILHNPYFQLDTERDSSLPIRKIKSASDLRAERDKLKLLLNIALTSEGFLKEELDRLKSEHWVFKALELEAKNATLLKENEALKKRLDAYNTDKKYSEEI